MATIAEQSHISRADKITYTAPEDRAVVDAHLFAMATCIWPQCTSYKVVGTRLCPLHIGRAADWLGADLSKTERPPRTKAKPSALDLVEEFKAGRRIQTYDEDVYIVKVDDLIKIGYSANIERRMKQYAPGTEILAIFPGTRKIEAYLHKKYAVHLTKGREWFADCVEIRNLVASMVAMYGEPNWVTAGPKQVDAPQYKQATQAKRDAHRRATAHLTEAASRARDDYIRQFRGRDRTD